MTNINFTLDQIQQIVEKTLNLEWTDRVIFNHEPKNYHSADLYWDFGPMKPKYLYLRDKKDKRYLAKVHITNDKCVINLNGDITDVTNDWLELLNKNQQSLIK